MGTKSRLKTMPCAKKLWRLTMLLSRGITNVFSVATRLLRNVKNTWRNSIFIVKMRRNVKPPKPWLNNKNLKRIVCKKKEKFNENKNNCEKFKRKPSQKKWNKLPKLKLAKKSLAKWTKKNWQIWILKQS